jgi:hypothetical protein
MTAIKAAARPFLQYDGRNEFEGHKTRRIYSVIEKTLACNPLVVDGRDPKRLLES